MLYILYCRVDGCDPGYGHEAMTQVVAIVMIMAGTLTVDKINVVVAKWEGGGGSGGFGSGFGFGGELQLWRRRRRCWWWWPNGRVEEGRVDLAVVLVLEVHGSYGGGEGGGDAGGGQCYINSRNVYLVVDDSVLNKYTIIIYVIAPDLIILHCLNSAFKGLY